MKTRALFIHRRDLRLIDNTALNKARAETDEVAPCFIFDPRQVDEQPYRSSNAIQFMVESLEELQKEYEQRDGKLFFFYGESHEVIEDLLKGGDVTHLYFNNPSIYFFIL